MTGPDPTSKTKMHYGDIPEELSFEEVIRNRTAPVSQVFALTLPAKARH